MRKIILFLLFLQFQLCCFAQNRVLDSLKATLRNAKTDTARLRLYLALGEASSKNDKWLYTEPALQLVDQLFLVEKDKQERQKLIGQEQSLLSLMGVYYRNGSVAEWGKAMAYLQHRLQAIEKTGDQRRAGSFLYGMAGVSIDQKKDSALFRKYITRSISVAKEIKDTTLMVNGYLFMGAFYSSAGNYEAGLDAIQSSVSSCREMSFDKGLIQSHRLLAILYRDFNESDLALENLQTALAISYKTKDSVEICLTLRNLGNFYARQKDITKAIENLELVQKINGSIGNPPFTSGDIYLDIGNAYSDNMDYKQAQFFLEKSLSTTEGLSDQKEKANDNWRLPANLMHLGNVHYQQNHYEIASNYHTRCVRFLDSIGDPYQTKSYMLYLLARDYFGLKNFARAKELSDIANVEFKRDWFDVEGRADIELLSFRIDSARGDGFGALSHYKEYASLKERLSGDEIKREAQKDKFNAEKEKQKSEQDKKDAIARRTRNLQYVAIGAMLLLGVFLCYGYIVKNRDKKKIEKAYADLQSAQSQLVQSEKMASLGELTAGIAHEIQNPLNFVNNFSEVNSEVISELVDEVDKGNTAEVKLIAGDIKDNSEKIKHHGKRADAIVKGMLQHSSSGSGKKEPTDINALADEYLRLAYHGLRAKDSSFNATMKTDFDPSIGNINIVPQDIGRVILNLISNAFYAAPLPPKGGFSDPDYRHVPTVWVSTKRERDKVVISVRDNGPGIPAEIRDKIFQPFFTTKPTGQGTGLGLSLSYDIVKAHGGELKVDTEEGKGSEFIITLPV